MYSKTQLADLVKAAGVGPLDTGVKLLIGLKATGQTQISLMLSKTTADLLLLDEATPKTIQLKTNETMLLAIRNYRLDPFQVKVLRRNGFPVVKVINCQQATESDMTTDCLARAEKVKDEQQQILRKNH
jgi:hypothetical protein